MIHRVLTNKINDLWKVYPILTITGPRQSGKTTLIKSLDFGLPYVTLEDPDIKQIALEDPRGFLSNYPKGAMLDEAQNAPQLFSYIQSMVDSGDQKYILSGSQNFQLLAHISQSLAGRTAILKLLPLSLTEINEVDKFERFHEYIFRGSYPRIYDKSIDPTDYYPSYINTYIERDVRMVKNIDNLALFSKFIKLCAGRIGQPINISNLANDAGISPNTATAWLSILETSYIIHFVQPYHKNYNKRLIKSPKLYFYDSGVACSLLGIEKADQLTSFHLIGNLFENMVVNELMKYNTNQAKMPNMYFWQNRNRKEIDIIVDKPELTIPIEIKSGSTLSTNYFKNLKYWKSLTNEKDSKAYVIYGGEKTMQIGNDTLVSWDNLNELFDEL